MTATRDYYDVLGVDRDADEATIKKAFRRLARELHPDVNKNDPQAEDKFKEAAEAYEVLSDPDRRATYDRYGHEGLRSGGYAPNFDTFGSVADIFTALFGGGGAARDLRRPADPDRGARPRRRARRPGRRPVCADPRARGPAFRPRWRRPGDRRRRVGAAGGDRNRGRGAHARGAGRARDPGGHTATRDAGRAGRRHAGPPRPPHRRFARGGQRRGS